MDITEISIVHHIGIVLAFLWVFSSFGFCHPVVYFISFIYLYQVNERYTLKLRKRLQFEERKQANQRKLLSDSETVRWLNHAIEKIWPICMEQLASQKFLLPVIPWFLDKYKPWTARKAVVQHLYLGRNPPMFTEVRVLGQSADDDHLVLELGMNFLSADDMSAILAVKLRKRLGFGIWAKMHVTGMHVEGKVLVGVKFLRQWPFIERLRVCFVEPPYFQMTVKPIFNHGLDVTELPGIAGWLDKILAVAFEQTLVEPNMLVVDAVKLVSGSSKDWFFVDEKRPIAFAKVEIVEGADLKPSDPNGLADPYVKGHLGPYRFRTKTQRKTLAPKWQEEFKIPICTWDSSNILFLEVRDKDHFVDDTLGDCSVNISELRGGQRHDKWLPLQKIKMGRLHLAITVADVDGKEGEHISDEDLIKSKQGPSSKASEAPEHDFAHTRHSENASKLADNFEPINIEGQSETGIWVHHPGSEGSRVWEPRKAKARHPETQLLREDCETIDSTRSVGSGSHNNGLSSDEEKVGRPRSFGSIRTSLRKIGSMFHKDKNEDSQNMGGVPVVATPRVNIRAVGDKVPVVKLVVDRDPEPFAGMVDKESPSHEKAEEASQGSGNVKGKAKSFLKQAGHNLKHVMSKKGSDKIKSGPSLSPAAEDGYSKSDSSDDNPFRIMLDEKSSATSRDCTQKVGGLPADSLAAEEEHNHVHVAVAPGDAKGSPFRDVDGSDAEERSDRKGSFRDMDMSEDDVSDAEERSDRKGSFRDMDMSEDDVSGRADVDGQVVAQSPPGLLVSAANFEAEHGCGEAQ